VASWRTPKKKRMPIVARDAKGLHTCRDKSSQR
jgi:hypothetical protein